MQNTEQSRGMRPNRSVSAGVVSLLVVLLGAGPNLYGQNDQGLDEDGGLIRQGHSHASGDTEGADFLLLPVGARSFALGGAVTALRGSGEAVLWNPAGVASFEKRRALFNHSENAFETQTDVLALIWPVKKLGTLGLTYYLVDFGELQNTDREGRVQGNINFRNQEFLLTYAAKLVGGLEGGINYKLIQIVFRCDGLCPEQQSFTRTTHAVDIGLLYNELLGLPLRIGGSIRHLGLPIGDTESDPLPTRVRLGAAYDALSTFLGESPFALMIAMDLEDRLKDPGDPDLMVGSEFSVSRAFFLRAGYSFVETGTGGPAIGLGLEQEWFYVDLSRGFDDVSAATGEESVQVTFGLIF